MERISTNHQREKPLRYSSIPQTRLHGNTPRRECARTRARRAQGRRITMKDYQTHRTIISRLHLVVPLTRRSQPRVRTPIGPLIPCVPSSQIRAARELRAAGKRTSPGSCSPRRAASEAESHPAVPGVARAGVEEQGRCYRERRASGRTTSFRTLGAGRPYRCQTSSSTETVVYVAGAAATATVASSQGWQRKHVCSAEGPHGDGETPTGNPPVGAAAARAPTRSRTRIGGRCI